MFLGSLNFGLQFCRNRKTQLAPFLVETGSVILVVENPTELLEREVSKTAPNCSLRSE
jgi:hypothetical protein